MISYPISEKCLRNTAPPCVEACPYRLNVQQFMERIKGGRFDLAYHNTLVSGIVFPEIAILLCGRTCEQVCPHGVSVNALERACIDLTNKKEPHVFRLPARGKSVAIVGGGLSGLACGVKLAAKKYSVTVFEATDHIGGSLLPLLPSGLLQTEFERQLGRDKCDIRLNAGIVSLDIAASFDAVYIATGQDGPDFGLLNSWDKETLETGEPGVFLGGRLCGADHAGALAQGIKASYAIEYYTKVGLPQPREETVKKNSASVAAPSGHPMTQTVYATKEEAVAAAQSCDLCLCSACIDNCVFMQKRGLTPQVIERDGMMSEVPPRGLEERVGTRMILSCAQCGLCREVCPQGIDIGDFLLDKRTKLRHEGAISPALHDYFIREMQDCSERLFFFSSPGQKLHDLFFPGCQSISSDPEQVLRAYEWLRRGDKATGILLSCCGVSAEWEGDASSLGQNLERIRKIWQDAAAPTLVTNCPNCMRVFRKYAPEIPVASIYERLVERGLPPDAEKLSVEQYLFHPCASLEFPEVRQAALQVASACCRQPVCSDEQAACCGLGGHVYPAAPEIACTMLEEASSRSPLPYLAYCANCRNLFLHTGKECRHLLNVVFSVSSSDRPWHIHELQRNRRWLYDRLRGKQGGIAGPEPRHFSSDLLAKMDRELLSALDVEDMIEKASASDEVFCDTRDCTFLASGRYGALTLWAQWREEAEGYQVCKVYAHRMELDQSLPRLVAAKENTPVDKFSAAVPEYYVCRKCRRHLALLPASIRYLGHEFHQELARCPSCGRILITEDFARTRLHEVEIMLEDK